MKEFFFKLVILMTTSALWIPQAYAAQCQGPDGRWYDYSSSMCQSGGRQSSEVAASSEPWVPKIGMTQAEVELVTQSKDCYKAASNKWCGYHRVNRTQTALGTEEQWIWVNVHNMPIWYMYFTNGILTAIQE